MGLGIVSIDTKAVKETFDQKITLLFSAVHVSHVGLDLDVLNQSNPWIDPTVQLMRHRVCIQSRRYNVHYVVLCESS